MGTIAAEGQQDTIDRLESECDQLREELAGERAALRKSTKWGESQRQRAEAAEAKLGKMERIYEASVINRRAMRQGLRDWRAKATKWQAVVEAIHANGQKYRNAGVSKQWFVVRTMQMVADVLDGD